MKVCNKYIISTVTIPELWDCLIDGGRQIKQIKFITTRLVESADLTPSQQNPTAQV